MKKYYSLAVACIALFLTSCQKEDLNGAITNSTSSTAASSTADLSLSSIVSSDSVSYGALIGAPKTASNGITFQFNIADQLGISCMRGRVIVPSTVACPLVKSKYQILLNFNRGDYASGTPMKFFTDLTQYAKDLTTSLAVYTINKPKVAVIENEESNKAYYSGSARDYINQLSTAITIMHANGIKVANGGITDQGLNYLVYQDFISQGKTDSAVQFKSLTKVSLQYAPTLDRAAFVDTLLQAYTQMDLDYVNFHWKGTSPNMYVFQCLINYLKKRTGKPVISNELGQFDTDPNTLISMMQLCTANKFPYAIWYSPDENAGKKEMPLQHSTGQLTNNGVTYKNFILN